jgi:hypothetical protein
VTALERAELDDTPAADAAKAIDGSPKSGTAPACSVSNGAGIREAHSPLKMSSVCCADGARVT